MRTGEVEANLLRLNEEAKLPCLGDLIQRKIVGAEKGVLGQVDLRLHRDEYERLRSELRSAFESSQLPELPRGAPALDDLLVRVRLAGKAK
jgi:hypothetical protein